MTSKHTKGPWASVKINNLVFGIVAEGEQLAQTTYTPRMTAWPDISKQVESNANLIAKSPDMLQLIDECETAFHVLMIGSDHGITPQAMEACQAAYKKCRDFINSFKKEAHNGQ